MPRVKECVTDGVSMTPDKFRKDVQTVFTSSDWIRQAADWLGVSKVTVYRWLAGTRKIGGPTETALKEKLKSTKGSSDE